MPSQSIKAGDCKFHIIQFEVPVSENSDKIALDIYPESRATIHQNVTKSDALKLADALIKAATGEARKEPKEDLDEEKTYGQVIDEALRRTRLAAMELRRDRGLFPTDPEDVALIQSLDKLVGVLVANSWGEQVLRRLFG